MRGGFGVACAVINTTTEETSCNVTKSVACNAIQARNENGYNHNAYTEEEKEASEHRTPATAWRRTCEEEPGGINITGAHQEGNRNLSRGPGWTSRLPTPPWIAPCPPSSPMESTQFRFFMRAS